MTSSIRSFLRWVTYGLVGSVYDLGLVKGWLARERLDDLLKPENMTKPR